MAGDIDGFLLLRNFLARNTVLFRVNLKTPCTFEAGPASEVLRPEFCCEDLLQRLRDAVVGAFQNSSAPYAKVLEARLERSGAVKLQPCLTRGCGA